MRPWAPVAALALAGALSAGCTGPSPQSFGVTSNANGYAMSGRVVALPDRPVRVCASEAEVLIEGDITTCHLGVNAVGIDLERLQHRREDRGSVEGYASVVGRWDGQVLHVTQQADPQPQQPDSLFTTPPCSPPPEGWPRVPEMSNLDSAAISRFVAAHPGTHAAVVRPSPQEALWMVTTVDVATAETELRPVYGAGLCVVRSVYTRADYDAAEQAFPFGVALGVVARSAGSPDPDGQWRVVVNVLYVTDDLLDRQRDQPAGLVRLAPALRPL